MNRFAILAIGLALLLCAPLANAALTINFKIDAGPVTLCGSGADTGPVTCNINVSGVSASVVTAVSNSPGSPSVSELLGDTVQVTSTANHTLTIWFTAQDFTLPTGNLMFQSGLVTNATLGNGGGGTTGLQSCVDDANGTAPALGCSGGSLTNANQTIVGTGSASQTIVGSANATSPYSLEQALTFTLHNGTDLNTTTTTSLALPEPASLTLFGGLALLAGWTVRRRAKRAI
jgi:hypothetical protein